MFCICVCAENKVQRKVFLPNKLLECLPRSSMLPNERLRWNTNEVSVLRTWTGSAKIKRQEEPCWSFIHFSCIIGTKVVHASLSPFCMPRCPWARCWSHVLAAVENVLNIDAVYECVWMAKLLKDLYFVSFVSLSLQEIASYLITFDRHDEWLSCSLKTRYEPSLAPFTPGINMWPHMHLVIGFPST